jgi:large repetitive protein
MRRARLLTALPLLLVAATQARADDPPNFQAYSQARAVAPAAAAQAPAGGFVASVDEKTGSPSFYWAQAGVPLPAGLAGAPAPRIARYHLQQHAAQYNLTAAALGTASPVLVHDIGHGGVIVVFRQAIDGVEVLNSDMKVLTKPTGELVAIGGSLHPGAIAGVAKKLPKFHQKPAEAIRFALKDLYGAAPQLSALLPDPEKIQGAYAFFDLKGSIQAGSKSVVFTAPARVKKVYYPMPGTLVPAYYLELTASQVGARASDVFAYVIAADDGRLLTRHNLTQFDSYKYRVWADPALAHNIPADGPLVDYTPHPTGQLDNTVPVFATPSLIDIEGFNNPPGGKPDPWLPVGATETTGNNVDAFADLAAPDLFGTGDVRADVTAAGVFDRIFDVAAEPLSNPNQSKAAVTQLFYTTNWLHDWWYDSGFNEAAGVAQASNFGRGGVEGDAMNAEGQDYAGLDNANMSTPADGMPPRMRMYLWSGQNDLNLDIGAPISASWQAGSASFGGLNFDINGTFALVDDGSAAPTLGCNTLVNDLTGKIAVIDRGSCAFVVKAKNAQNAGATGVLILNNAANAAPPGMGGSDATITIGTLSTTKENGALLKPAMLNGAVTGHLKRVSGPLHDGTIDNSVIGHEWGHYLHHRLVNCGSQQCGGMSEGWADFDALLMVLRQGDNFAGGTFALAQYATVADANELYYGIRRLPYTRNMAKNPFTFKHMSDAEMLPNIPMGFGGANNAEVHNAGEIWAEMLFSAYTGLQMNGGHTFDVAKRRMSDYVVAGMILTPVEPTFTEQRDAVLAATEAADHADMLILANEFATRGAGSCAESPPRFATDNVGIVESYELKSRHSILSVKIDDSVKSCDSDGLLDADEAGKITIELKNDSPLDLVNTTAQVLAGTPGVILPGGDTVTFPLLKPFQKATQTLDIQLDGSFVDVVNLKLDVVAINNGSCIAKASVAADPRVNLDDLVGISTIDTVDSDKPTWTPKGTSSGAIWTRIRDANHNYKWSGLDFGSVSDTSLESADIKVSQSGSFVFSFDHDYFFENDAPAGPNPAIYWDGGVIEITDDGGATWKDVNLFTSPGYGGTIGDPTNAGQNPLGGRMGYIAKNASYPAMDSVALNFGQAFAGKTVRIRFRAGSDLGTSAPGWEIDNMGVLFVDNKPFSAVVPDGTTCNGVPVADAGPDQVAASGAIVPLDGSKSKDPENDPLTFAWKQLKGTAANLVGAQTATPLFVAPDVATDEILTFQLTVSDGKGSAGDTVDVVVSAKIVATGSATASSSATGTGGAGGAGGAGGTGGAGGMGGATSTVAGVGGAGGGEGGGTFGAPHDPTCGCSVVGADSSPVQTSVLASLMAALGLFFRRARRTGKRRED